MYVCIYTEIKAFICHRDSFANSSIMPVTHGTIFVRQVGCDMG